MTSVISFEEKKLLQAIEAQTHLYHELELAVEKSLDGYFDALDDLMVHPQSVLKRSLVEELEQMRTYLAEMFEYANRLKRTSYAQLVRLERLNGSASSPHSIV